MKYKYRHRITPHYENDVCIACTARPTGVEDRIRELGERGFGDHYRPEYDWFDKALDEHFNLKDKK